MAIKAQSNKGLSEKFFEALSHVDPVARPEVIDQTVDDSPIDWQGSLQQRDVFLFLLQNLILQLDEEFN